MHPTAAERDALFEAFARALFRQDMDALYEVVSPTFVWRYHDGVSTERVLAGREAISFMTFRVSETVRATGEEREQRGIERYTFEDGKIATKDVYRKPIGA
jgi:ketosteroid isomerase-like protein